VETKSNIQRLGLLLGPALFLIIQLTGSDAFERNTWIVLAIAAWMIIWWVTEAIPIFATALLPLILFPYSGVFDIKEAAVSYAHPVIFLFMGGFIIALGLEKHNLHQRIALNLIRITGTHANGIILGFMIATAALSMWISNTATAVMMLPIAMSVIDLLETKEAETPGGKRSPFSLFAVSLFLGIAYAANIGGTATIIGTPPNVVFVGFVEEFYQYNIAFNRWLLIGIPVSFTLLAATFILLTKVLFPSKLGKIPGAKEIIATKLKGLGVFSKEEKLVTAVFACTALAWIFKNPINNLLGSNLLNDTVTAMTGGILMFIIPTDFKTGEKIISWEEMKRLPWGILILFGGGICLAKAMESAGLIQLIGTSIAGHPFFTGWLLILALTSVMLFMTELMSNIALTTIFIPVAFGIAQGSGINPLILSIPLTLAASCAFMMPISTPPNAIVFASGHIRMKDMMLAGFILNIISVAVLVLFSVTLFEWVYGNVLAP